MIIEQDVDELYNDEYDVRIRRLSAMLAQTTPQKEGLGAALVRFNPGETVRKHSNKPGVEEMFILLEGSAEFGLEDETFALNEGDVAFATVGQAHSFTNTSDAPGRLLAIWWRPAGYEAPSAAGDTSRP